MEYKLKVNEETYQIEVERLNDESLKIIINDNQYMVDYSLLEEHHIRMNLNGRGISAYTAADSTGKTISVNGRSFFIEDAEALELMKKSGKKGSDLPDAVTPPMPSIVIAVLVNEGDQVKKGQGVIVVSAMKMETTLYAPYDGTISSIEAAEEDKVNPGDILVHIEKDEITEEAVE